MNRDQEEGVAVQVVAAKPMAMSTVEDAAIMGGGREAALFKVMFQLGLEHPRNMGEAIDKAISLATSSVEAAEACYFSLPRGGKTISGPSIALAEIMQHAWGRMMIDASDTRIGKTTVTVRATGIDLESLNRVSVEVVRGILTNKGDRYPEHMIQTTAAAAQSVARRQAIFGLIPRAIVDRVYREARATAAGDIKTLGERIQTMRTSLTKAGLSDERVLSVVGRSSYEDVTVDDLLDIGSLWKQVRAGDRSIDEAFPDPKDPQGRKKQAASLQDKLAEAGAKTKAKVQGEPTDAEKAAILAREREEAGREPGAEG